MTQAGKLATFASHRPSPNNSVTTGIFIAVCRFVRLIGVQEGCLDRNNPIRRTSKDARASNPQH